MINSYHHIIILLMDVPTQIKFESHDEYEQLNRLAGKMNTTASALWIIKNNIQCAIWGRSWFLDYEKSYLTENGYYLIPIYEPLNCLTTCRKLLSPHDNIRDPCACRLIEKDYLVSKTKDRNAFSV